MKPDQRVIREWLRENLERKGRGARQALADFLGLRTEIVSRMTSAEGRTREISATELLRMAEFFGVSPPGIGGGFAEESARYETEGDRLIPIMGYVGAGAEVSPAFEQVPEGGLEQVELPYAVAGDMIGFQVRGDSQYPKYADGEILVVAREQPTALDNMIGQIAVVRTADDRRFVKQIMPGRSRGRFDLASFNAPTLHDMRVVWASPVRLVIPNIGIRRIVPAREAPPGRPSRKHSRAKTAKRRK